MGRQELITALCLRLFVDSSDQMNAQRAVPHLCLELELGHSTIQYKMCSRALSQLI